MEPDFESVQDLARLVEEMDYARRAAVAAYDKAKAIEREWRSKMQNAGRVPEDEWAIEFPAAWRNGVR